MDEPVVCHMTFQVTFIKRSPEKDRMVDIRQRLLKQHVSISNKLYAVPYPSFAIQRLNSINLAQKKTKS